MAFTPTTSLPFLNLCGLRRVLRHELLALVRDGEERNWHEIHGRLPTNWKDLISFENVATAIYNYEPMAIPGLAQTPDHARTLTHGT